MGKLDFTTLRETLKNDGRRSSFGKGRFGRAKLDLRQAIKPVRLSTEEK